MEPSLAVVRKLLFLAGSVLAVIGVVDVLSLVLNPDWWRILFSSEGFGIFGDGILGRVQSLTTSLRGGLTSVVWGLLALGLGHLHPGEGAVDHSPVEPIDERELPL